MIIPNFKLADGTWAKYKQINRKTVWTKSGSVWNGINNRCNPNNAIQTIYAPEYIGCTMSENFKDFQFFVEWHMQQVGFNLKGYTIDKDSLVFGNKEYHEDKCVLIPQALNNFFIQHPNKNGLPQGVCFHIASLKYCANLNSFGKTKYLGCFETPELAHNAYLNGKVEESCIWLDKIKAGNIIVDSRVLERLQNYNS